MILSLCKAHYAALTYVNGQWVDEEGESGNSPLDPKSTSGDRSYLGYLPFPRKVIRFASSVMCNRAVIVSMYRSKVALDDDIRNAVAIQRKVSYKVAQHRGGEETRDAFSM